jgi:hypothetical protein
MRLDAARMTEALCRRCAPVAHPSRYEICLLFRVLRSYKFHPEKFFGLSICRTRKRRDEEVNGNQLLLMDLDSNRFRS